MINAQIALSLLIFPILGQEKLQLVDRILMLVNDRVITQSDVEKFKVNFKENPGLIDRNTLVGLNFKDSKVDDEEALTVLKREKLLQSEAARLDFYPSDESVEKEFKAIAQRNQMDLRSFELALIGQGLSPKSYKDFLKESMAKQALIDQEISSKIQISSEEIEDHLRIHNKELPLEVAEMGLAQIFIEGLSSASRELARKARGQLDAGKSFEDVAVQISKEIQTRTGDFIGNLKFTEINPKFQSALKGLKEGETSAVVESEKGFYMFKVLKMTKVKNPLRESAIQKARLTLTEKAYEKYLLSWFEEKLRSANIEQKKL